MSRVLLTALVVALCGVRAPAGEPVSREAAEQLVQPLLDGQWVTGLSIGLLVDGQTQTFGWGRVSADRDQAPDEQTIYEIGSISKVFTSILLADMVERGDLSLDDPVQKYLPDSLQLPQFEDQPIRLVHLATHTSALPRMPRNFKPADPGNPYADYTVQQMYDFLSGYKLTRAPGKRHGYSNLGAGLLGHVLGRKAGKSYEELLLERLAEPLKLQETRITLTDAMRQRLAAGYDVDGRPQKNWDIPTFAGAGAIRSNVREMLVFLAANLDPPAGTLGKAIRLTHEPRAEAGGNLNQIGLGWYISKTGYRWHNGQTGGYHSFAAFDPQHHTAVVVLCNTGTGLVDALGQQLLRLANGEEAELLKLPTTVQVAADVLQRYVGKFALTPAFALTVTREGDKLYVQATGQDRFRVYPTSDTKFYYRMVNAQIDFAVDDDGKVDKLTLHQNGQNLEGKRVEE